MDTPTLAPKRGKRRIVKILAVCVAVSLILIAVYFIAAGQFIKAVNAGDVQTAELLMRCGISPNLRSDKSTTMLYIAIYYRDINMVRALIRHGADVNAAMPCRLDTVTAIHGAVFAYRIATTVQQKTDALEVCRILVAHHCDVNRPGFFWFTPLDMALAGARDGDLALVRFLIQHGADYKQTHSIDHCSSLDFAVRSGHLAPVKYILSLGVYINVVDSSGQTPLDTAIFFEYIDIIKYLRAHGAKTGKELGGKK